MFQEHLCKAECKGYQWIFYSVEQGATRHELQGATRHEQGATRHELH